MTRLTILLVDPDDMTRTALAMLLNADGHDLVATDNWETAFHLASDVPFDLLISELSLPDRKECELMREMAARYGTRGILLSGFEEQLAGGWESAGFMDYLYKPVSFSRIESVLRAASIRPVAGLVFPRHAQPAA